MIVYTKLIIKLDCPCATHGFQSGNNKVHGTTYNVI